MSMAGKIDKKPDFDEITKFVFEKAEAKRRNAMCDSELYADSVTRIDGASPPTSGATTSNPSIKRDSQPAKTTSAPDPLGDLTRRFEALALMIEKSGANQQR